MGQTLTNGVYLPDEGERNCYNGLAANWQILDNSVGTIASHTTQIAGKANAVHTHTKSDITDFPAYGNAAGTICEGNDSRLSDARTPVSHTHTKSDVTDLFNSANEWTALNSYTKGIWLNGAREAYIFPENAASYSGLAFATESYTQSFRFGDFTTSNNEVSFNYNNAYLSIAAGYYSSDSKNKVEITPRNADESSIGTSSYKWKTFNGLNPGALSFPDGTTDNSDTTFNPDTTTWAQNGTSFTITAQVTGWLHIRIKNVTGNFVWVKRASSGSNQTWGLVGDSNSNSDISDIGLNVPVIKDKTYTLKLKTASFYAVIFLCLGNV